VEAAAEGATGAWIEAWGGIEPSENERGASPSFSNRNEDSSWSMSLEYWIAMRVRVLRGAESVELNRGLSLRWVEDSLFGTTRRGGHMRSTVVVHNREIVSKVQVAHMERSRNALAHPMGT
jgi:hypothetical protein